jgi:hypothetical protein
MLFIEILAGSWYALSYIPFGRKIVITFFKRTICKPCCDAYEASKGSGGGGAAGGSKGMASFSDSAAI